jgi:hypothetical protein
MDGGLPLTPHPRDHLDGRMVARSGVAAGRQRKERSEAAVMISALIVIAVFPASPRDEALLRAGGRRGYCPCRTR